MTEVIIISSFSLATCGLFYFWGKRRPTLTFWADVDLYYYPLAVIGVILLFLTATESRYRLALHSEYQKQRDAEVEKAARDVLKESFKMSNFLQGVIDPTKTCEGNQLANWWLTNACHQTFISRLAQQMAGLFFYIPGFLVLPRQVLRADLDPGCLIVTNRLLDKNLWQELQTIRPELDNEARAAAHMLNIDVANACERFWKSLTNEDEVPATGLPGVRADSPFPTSSFVLAERVKEWLWPFVLIFALSLKIGKAEAALVSARRTS